MSLAAFTDVYTEICRRCVRVEDVTGSSQHYALALDLSWFTAASRRKYGLSTSIVSTKTTVSRLLAKPVNHISVTSRKKGEAWLKENYA